MFVCSYVEGHFVPNSFFCVFSSFVRIVFFINIFLFTSFASFSFENKSIKKFLFIIIIINSIRMVSFFSRFFKCFKFWPKKHKQHWKKCRKKKSTTWKDIIVYLEWQSLSLFGICLKVFFAKKKFIFLYHTVVVVIIWSSSFLWQFFFFLSFEMFWAHFISRIRLIKHK